MTGVQTCALPIYRHRGLDSVELFVDSGEDVPLRLGVPLKVDAGSVQLYAEVAYLVEPAGRVMIA